MSPLLRLATVAWCVGLGACGPSEPHEPGFDLRLVANAGLLDVIGAFQVVLVTNGTSLDCTAVKKTCINTLVERSRFVPLKDGAQTRRALLVPLDLVAGTPSTQALSLKDLPLGRDFALVVEALSKEPTPRLAGSACAYVKELVPGTNPTLMARIAPLDPYAACDPRIDL